MAKRILVPVDGSEESDRAVEFAAEEWPDARITLLHVINPARSVSGAEMGVSGLTEDWYENAERNAETLLSETVERADIDAETLVEVGRPVHTILEAADDFDGIVIGSQGRTGLSRVLLGSVAEGVVRKAEIPVTVVR
ncbi:universal stress protein [Halopenitus salinus]|uniref:Universal stress protein n=1 Tax=Halopenitus salinus TaxID=1198295 RepID=A0ABD5UZ54_9EURY